MNQHPRLLDFGSISVIFNKICADIENQGFYIDCQREKDGSIKTSQTIQVYLENQGIKQKLVSKKQQPLGAIQYEGSNDYSKKPPHIVNWRFYRDNLPEEWKSQLEKMDNGFRRDTNEGPRVDPTSLSIAFKFLKNDEQSNQFITELSYQMGGLLKKYDINKDH